MNARDIFKMEMYKNSTDKPYLIVGGVLSGLGIILTACWLLMINVMNTSQAEGSTSGSGGGIIIFLGLLVMISFSFLVGTYFLGLLYPFHLLNVDYRSKVLSLMVASGVSRVKYYFVKIAATVLSTLIMMTVILVIPIVTLLIFNMTSIIGAVKMFTGLSIAPNIIIVLIGGILSSISAVVVMASAVIMLRGKVSSFFVYIGFSFGINMVSQFIQLPVALMMSANGDSSASSVMFTGFNGIFSIIIPVLSIVGFGLMGMLIIRRQDL